MSIFPNIFRYLRLLIVKHLTHSKSIIFFESFMLHLFEIFSDSLCLLEHLSDISQSIIPVRLIVLKRQFLFDIDYGIQTEACYPTVKPPVYHFINLFSELWILPVKIRLFLMERMQIIFIGSRYRFPNTSTKIRAPVARQFSIFFLSDIKISAILSIRVCHSLFKPFMLIRTVVYYKIHHYVNIALFCLSNKPVHRIKISKQWIYIIIIRNVVSLIYQRRSV